MPDAFAPPAFGPAFATERPMRRKRHRLLLLLDEFPLLGRLPHFETSMGAMAGYGLKAYLVAQSPNHITRAYGRDNVIIDNCATVVAFAAADAESARRISDMAGDVVEVRPQDSEQRPRALLGPRKGSVTYREERRPLILPGEVRKLPVDEELIFVAGARPIRAKKLRFDEEPVFLKRLLPAPRLAQRLTVEHDWSHVRALGRLEADGATGAVRVTPANAAQGDLFASAPSIADRAGAGLKPPRTARNGAARPRSKSTGV